MTKNSKFITTLIFIIVTRIYDVYSTFTYTPTLDKEANPLVSIIGLNWTALLCIIGLIIFYFIYAFYYSTYKPLKIIPEEKGVSFNNFISYMYLGHKEEWYTIFYKFPKNIKRLNQYLGEIGSILLVYVGIITSIMWILINHSQSYKRIHSAKLIYLIIFIGSSLVFYRWNKVKYNYYIAEKNVEDQ